MRVQEVMTTDAACCSPDTKVKEAASMMEEQDCGCLPVVTDARRVVGVVTDRDIVCRCVAQGKGPETEVGEAMTSPARCCGPDDDVSEATRIMAEGKVRRVPVVDDAGCCVGIVSQADIARAEAGGREQEIGEVVQRISRPTQSPSEVDRTDAGRPAG